MSRLPVSSTAPAVGAVKPGAWTMESGRKHWAYQPVREPAVPKVKNTAWVQNPIDNFVLAKLEAAGLKPAPKADRRTLLRRSADDTDDARLPAQPAPSRRVASRAVAEGPLGRDGDHAQHVLAVATVAERVEQEAKRMPGGRCAENHTKW